MYWLAHPAINLILIPIASVALTLLALQEVGFAYPVAWWQYLSVAFVFAAILIRREAASKQLVRLGVLAAIVAFIAELYIVNWTTRKPFLRDLARVHVGMSEGDVRRIMGRYMEGTGWPTPPFPESGSPSTLNIAGSGSQYPIEASAAGQMVIRDSLVFRHSNDGAFNSDWGIISFSRGRVVGVEFSPD